MGELTCSPQQLTFPRNPTLHRHRLPWPLPALQVSCWPSHALAKQLVLTDRQRQCQNGVRHHNCQIESLYATGQCIQRGLQHRVIKIPFIELAHIFGLIACIWCNIQRQYPRLGLQETNCLSVVSERKPFVTRARRIKFVVVTNCQNTINTEHPFVQQSPWAKRSSLSTFGPRARTEADTAPTPAASTLGSIDDRYPFNTRRF